MVRKTQMTGEEILTAEKAADDRRKNRNNGYGLAKERDRGFARLHPYYSSASEIEMMWGADNSRLFQLKIKPYGKEAIRIILDADEVQKWIRWA